MMMRVEMASNSIGLKVALWIPVVTHITMIRFLMITTT